jgi:hypothetical protein
MNDLSDPLSELDNDLARPDNTSKPKAKNPDCQCRQREEQDRGKSAYHGPYKGTERIDDHPGHEEGNKLRDKAVVDDTLDILEYV